MTGDDYPWTPVAPKVIGELRCVTQERYAALIRAEAERDEANSRADMLDNVLQNERYITATLEAERDVLQIAFNNAFERGKSIAAERDALRALLAEARGALPQGWSVRTNCDNEQRWIVITGPRGQSAAFSVPLDGVRAEILRELQRDFDAALRESGK